MSFRRDNVDGLGGFPSSELGNCDKREHDCRKDGEGNENFT